VARAVPAERAERAARAELEAPAVRPARPMTPVRAVREAPVAQAEPEAAAAGRTTTRTHLTAEPAALEVSEVPTAFVACAASAA